MVCEQEGCLILKRDTVTDKSYGGYNKMDTAIKERWFDLSLPEQMVNIGNEVKRAVRFDKDSDKKKAFIGKALEYIELTMDDPKNKAVIPEIKIGKEILEDYIGDHELDYTKEQIRDYYMDFVFLLKN